MATISFKHYYKSSTTIGSGTIKFIPYTATEPLTQLATPQNVTADGTTVSWDEVENATSYEIYADGVSIGTVDAQDQPAGTGYNVSLKIASDYWNNGNNSANFSYSLDNGATWTEVSEQNTYLTNTTQIKLKFDAEPAGLTLRQSVYDSADLYSGTQLTAEGLQTAFESDNIVLTTDTGFNLYCIWD